MNQPNLPDIASAERNPPPEKIPQESNNDFRQLSEVVERIIQRIQVMADNVEAGVRLGNRIAIAKSLNWDARKNSQSLFPVPASNGATPAGFPRTVRAFRVLSGDDLLELIVHYGIVDPKKIPRKIATRRKLLARHIGMSLYR
ncbi:unnamed protein product [Rhizoctonia solani]|uniref:Uncharacterized protein n=1 Tax=Rhizoctonia solani TaxID=456999 RepID=A0A8H2WUM2_9AGAM|nr:unnamed protein product [Rhizoctonia solani]